MAIDHNIPIRLYVKDDTDEGFDKAETRTQQFERKMSRSTGGLITGFDKLAIAAGLVGAGTVALGVASSMASANMEMLRLRLEQVTGSAEEGARAYDFLVSYSARTPFQLPDIIQAAASLEAFGAKAIDTITPIGDLAVFMGVEIPEAAEAFGRAFSAGAGAADILRERGVLNLIRLQTGIDDLTKLTLPEFREAMLDAFTDPEGRIAGGTAKLAETLGGKFSTVKDNVVLLSAAIGDTLSPMLKELAEGMIPIITGLVKILANFAPLFATLAVPIAALIGTITLAAHKSKEMAREMGDWGEEINELSRETMELYNSLNIMAAGAGISTSELIRAKLEAGFLGEAFAPLIVQMREIAEESRRSAQTTEEFYGAFDALASRIGINIPTMHELVDFLFNVKAGLPEASASTKTWTEKLREAFEAEVALNKEAKEFANMITTLGISVGSIPIDELTEGQLRGIETLRAGFAEHYAAVDELRLNMTDDSWMDDLPMIEPDMLLPPEIPPTQVKMSIVTGTQAAVRATAKTGEVIASRAVASAATQEAAAEIFAAHAWIPFAGVGISSGMIATMMAELAAVEALSIFHEGGYVKGVGERLALLEAGEYVVSAPATSMLGIPFLEALNKMPASIPFYEAGHGTTGETAYDYSRRTMNNWHFHGDIYDRDGFIQMIERDIDEGRLVIAGRS